jgi:CubicO group peptidase (beta-lactamase class C family)
MIKKLSLLVCCWLLAGPSSMVRDAAAAARAATADASDPTHVEVRTWIETNVPTLMTEGKMPGFSIAVVKDGETIYADGFGSRDPELNLPATADTLYGIGSITKSFVAIGIMQLVEEGKISLSDPVSEHVPLELGIEGDPIRIHHLLTHSLGVPSLGSSTVAIYRGLGLDTGIPLASANDFYRFVNGARDELVARPGERFFYHNAAWRMLGHIIQEASGVPFDRYLKERVIDPLGMRRTTMDPRQFAADPDHIVPHLKKADGGNEPSRFPYPDPTDNPDFSFLSAAGGIVSSVNEMTRYVRVQIERGAYDDQRIASAESFEAMQRLHIREPDGYYGVEGYGYGLAVTPDFLGHTMISHGGSISVSTAYMAFVPELKAGVVMMGNSSGMDYATIAESVLAILMGQDPAVVIPATRIKNRMEALAGSYEVYRGLDRLEVVIKGGMLYLDQTSPLTGASSSTPLVPEDPTLESTTFSILRNGLERPVEFTPRDQGSFDLFVGRYRYHKVD